MSNEQSKMTFGIQPTCWTNDDFPEIGNDTPYQKILDETKKARYAGGSTGHNYPSHLPSLLEALRVNNLKIASTWAGTSFTTGVDADAALADFQAQVTFLKEVGARDVVVAELAGAVNQIRTKRVLEDRPILSEAQWFLLTRLLDEAAKYAKDQDMQLSYHPHVGTCVMTLEETIRLLDSTNPDYVGLCLDTGHLRYGGASLSDVEAFTKKYVRRITHVHLKNVRKAVLPVAVKGSYSFYQAIESGIFTVPGDTEGDDLSSIVKTLNQAGYSGWMVIEAEQDPANANPFQYANTARKFLEKELGY